MGKEQKIEVAIIPAGSYVSIMGCRFTLLEDTKVEANQANLDYILKDQADFNKGIGIVGEHPTDKLGQGALSSMKASAFVGGFQNANANISIQKTIQDAAKTLSAANNARFISRAEWRTNMLESLLSYVHIKTIDDALTECQKIEKYVFGDGGLSSDIPLDWRI